MRKIDIFTHIFPRPFHDLMMRVAPHHKDMGKRVRGIPMLTDLGERFRVMDRYEGYQQILSIASPPIEALGGPAVAVDLARAANDGMADLVRQYPERFPGFIASVPMNAGEAAFREVERAVEQLGARGVQLFTNVLGAPLVADPHRALFDQMARYDLPIWAHPARGADFPDYQTEERSLYEIWWTFGWPYETSAMMARIVFDGLFDRYPDLKIITHHMGGMVPYFEGRVGHGWDQLGTRSSDVDYTIVLKRLRRRPLEYFKLFYADTAVFGAQAATQCGLAFFGADRVLFASDSPFDPEQGSMYIRETIDVIDRLDIAEPEREKIYWRNAVRLLKLES